MSAWRVTSARQYEDAAGSRLQFEEPSQGRQTSTGIARAASFFLPLRLHLGLPILGAATPSWRDLKHSGLSDNAPPMEAPPNPDFWNRAARTREFTHPLDRERLTRLLPRDAVILDFGCGQGRLTGELIGLGYINVLGLDSSTEMIRIARQRVPDAGFAENDGEQLPCGDASLDAVLLFAVLTCIPADEAQKNLLREFKRVLRPGGLLLISDYPLQSDARNLQRYETFQQELGGWGRFRLPGGAVLRHHAREWFADLLAGFRVEEAVELDARTMNGNPARILQLWAQRE
jgi:SAM-dependent methyltransferase